MQLVYPVKGTVTVTLPGATLTVTPYRAVLIGSWVQHHVAAPGQTVMRSVFINPDLAPLLEDNYRVLQVSNLLHELITEAGNHYGDTLENSTEALILKLIRKLVFAAPAVHQVLALPRINHSRLQALQTALLQPDLFPDLRLDAAAGRAALSPRHFSRLFKAATGVNFATWRSLARITVAADRLSQGETVSGAASHTGYSSASAFAADFKKHTGMTPGEYLKSLNPQV